MYVDELCFEKGCACYAPLFGSKGVAVADKEWQGIRDEELEKWSPEIRSIIRLFEAKLKERNTA
jgi:hypothetical protein